jgi:hypothetical protein
VSARLLSLAVAATALVVGVAVLVVPVDAEPRPSTQAPAHAPARTQARTEARTEAAAAALLRHWDLRRAGAWAAGDPGALRDLYTARSATGRADRAMLRSWRRRGFRVEGLRMQLLAVHVRVWSGDLVVLRVTDRVAGGLAVGRGARVRLPRDAASTRTITLRRVASRWRVSSVIAQARPARTTSWTVRSRNP